MPRFSATADSVTANPAPDKATTASEAVRFVYLLFLLTPVFAGLAVLGYAMVRRHECRVTNWLGSHLGFQRRLFWQGFVLVLVGGLTTPFWVGWAILLLALIYWLLQSLRGLRLYMAEEPCPGAKRRQRREPVELENYDWDPDGEEAPWAVRQFRLAPLVVFWRNTKFRVRRTRAELPEILLGRQFDDLTAPTAARRGDRLFWEIFEIWEEAFGFLGIITVAGVLLWSLVLIAGPGDYTALAWIAGYLYLRLGLSVGLVFGGYAVAGWRFAWARHSGEEPDDRVATFSALTLLAVFSALGAFIATRFV